MTRLLAERFQPATFPPKLVVLLTLVFAFLTGLRGTDWLTADPSALSPTLTGGWVPITWAGLGLIVGAFLLVAAIASRRHFLVWLAHLHLAIIYAGIVLTGFPVASALGSGYSALVAPAGGVLWHYALWKLTGPRPRAGSPSHQGGAACGTHS